MRYLSLFIWSCSIALMGFSQSPQNVTLVFVSSTNQPHKNYEAVIDDVSYFSESNTSTGNQQISQGSRNTIWLSNFQPGEHTIEIYSIRNGSKNERAGNSPVYASTFTVKYGYETNIAVKSNGQVQLSERLGNNSSDSGLISGKNNSVNSSARNNYYTGNKTSAGKIDRTENDDFDNKNNDGIESTSTSDITDSNTAGNDNTERHYRHASKRVDTAVVLNDESNDKPEISNKNSTRIRSKQNSKYRFDDRNNDNNRKPQMNDDQFHELYESVRNQWLPGQKMKTLNNEFLNAEDNFSTSQAKQLIQLVTEEGNRLKLAKAVYPCITDPENFHELDDLLRYKKSRNELEDFVSESGQN